MMARRMPGKRGCRNLVLCGIVLATLTGCTQAIASRSVYHDPLTSIRLQEDDRTDEAHSHPGRLTTEEMAAVLRGLRVVSRQGILGSLVMGVDQGRPAFSSVEIQDLAPQLVRALEQATPHEIVTFYRRFSDAGVGLAVTSGGLFLHHRHLYVIVANNRTLPSAALSQSIVTEIDPIDNPLLPISRTDFRLLFEPAMAILPTDERRPWPYIDDGRLVAIDLLQLARASRLGTGDVLHENEPTAR